MPTRGFCVPYTRRTRIHTGTAVARIKRQALPLPITWLHQLEFRNALRLRVFWKEITPAQREASLTAMLADLAAGVLVHAAPSLADLTVEAERLSAHSRLTRMSRASARVAGDGRCGGGVARDYTQRRSL